MTYSLILLVCAVGTSDCTPMIDGEKFTAPQACYIKGIQSVAEINTKKRKVVRFICTDSSRADYYLGRWGA